MLNVAKADLISRPHERELHRTNVNLELKSLKDSTKISASNCEATLTTERLIIVSPQEVTYRVFGKGDRTFHNTAIPLKRTPQAGGFQQCRLVQPWFGPNRWEGLIIPAQQSTFEPAYEWGISLSFPSGGAFEFSEIFSDQARKVQAAQEQGIAEVLPEYTP